MLNSMIGCVVQSLLPYGIMMAFVGYRGNSLQRSRTCSVLNSQKNEEFLGGEMVVAKKVTKPKRLTPKPEVLRELYLLSGNNCAMPNCSNVIIDHAGVVVGHICHIEAAMPDGARFNEDQSNEERRALSNFVLMCAGHHAQIDSKKHEKTWTVKKLRKIKADHEKKFKGLDNSLEQAFQNVYEDSTDSLAPTNAMSFAKLQKLLPYCKLDSSEEPARRKQVNSFVKKLSKIPDKERQFMTSVVKRAMKLKVPDAKVCVHVDDVNSALSVSHNKIKSLGSALERYEVGCVGLSGGASGEDEWHVIINDPSDYLSWADISEFCKEADREIEDFLLRLNFGLLDET